jgi:hypothetical protein
MILLQFFAWSTPEQTLRRNVLGFFQICGQTLGALSEDPPWTDRGKAVLATQHATLRKSLNICGVGTHLINPRRAPQNDTKKVSDLLASMQSLLFRIEMTERARLSVSDEAPFVYLVTAVRDLRISFENSLEAIQQRINGVVAPGASPDTNVKIEEYRRQLDSLRDDPAVDTTDRRTAGRVLVLAGYYRALAESIDQCREYVEALNWGRWERSYI